MAQYILAKQFFYRGSQLRPGKVIDDAAFNVADLTAAGAILIPLPNAAAEAKAVQVRAQQARGLRGDELTDLYATFSETESAPELPWQVLTSLLSDGPVTLASAYSRTLPSGDPFPTSVEWWTADPGLGPTSKRILTKARVLDAGQNPTSITWTVYAADGVAVVATITDTITYSGPFEVSRTRTVA